MQVLCINLARACDRRASMIEQFRWLGMVFEIFSASDCRTSTERTSRRSMPKHDGGRGVAASRIS